MMMNIGEGGDQWATFYIFPTGLITINSGNLKLGMDDARAFGL